MAFCAAVVTSAGADNISSVPSNTNPMFDIQCLCMFARLLASVKGSDYQGGVLTSKPIALLCGFLNFLLHKDPITSIRCSQSQWGIYAIMI